MLFTKTDYLSRKCTRREYYAQFVTDGIIQAVSQYVGKDAIVTSTDPFFHDIPLDVWKRIPIPKLRTDTGRLSLFDHVCVVKEAARQIKDKHEVGDTLMLWHITINNITFCEYPFTAEDRYALLYSTARTCSFTVYRKILEAKAALIKRFPSADVCIVKGRCPNTDG